MKNFIRYSTVIFIFLTAQFIAAQTTAFNYQGKLTDANAPQATYQMQFKLYDAAVGGTQIGNTISNNAVAVSNGVFSILLDFGANVFTGANRYLEISVRRNTGENYTILTPRQQIASSPYSIRTLSAQQADTALDSQKLGGVAASEYVTNSSVGSSFIRNGTTTQTANFNISGNANIGGLTGLGTGVNGNFRLDSFGSIRAFSNASAHFVAETTGGTNSWARNYWRSPNRSWFMGTSQNFNGDQLYLVDETAGQTRMAISTGGFVGINNTNPQAGLDIRGTGAQVQQRITDNTSGNSLVLQGGAGSNMKVTGYNYNTNTAVPLNLSVDGANTIVGGNMTQNLSGLGLPKAMIWVNTNRLINKCYNGVTGVSATNAGQSACGFTVSGLPDGFSVRIDFGFPVNNSFFSLVMRSASTRYGGVFTQGEYPGINANQVVVDINAQFAPFQLIVY